jgi:phosphodiesterase/alkaline phosphatase D-like protein
MKVLALALSVAAAGLGLGAPSQSVAADLQNRAPSASLQITKGPKLERATDIWAIVRWTTNSIKGTSLRYGVVQYGTDPHHLNETATSPNRWNPNLPYMTYRVELNHLTPDTTYYYRVKSENALRVSEGAQSAVDKFTTEPAP